MSILDDTLELTPAGIPVSLRPFFQEYMLENLDPERSAFTVIERTLAWGRLPELRWLFARYEQEPLAPYRAKIDNLSRQRLKYWLCFFEITDYHRGERLWPH